MKDSKARESLEEKVEQNREKRIEGIKRWVEYIRTHEPDEWGEQQNRLINSQLESARKSEIDLEHRRRVEEAGRDFRS